LLNNSKNRIQLVIYEKGWIIEAIAHQWLAHLKEKDTNSIIEVVYGTPVKGANTYIHFIYLGAKLINGARNIVYVTHVDYTVKCFVILWQAIRGANFVTMSLQTKKYIDKILPGACVYSIFPSSLHFGKINRDDKRNITFGLFFRLYPDKRKNNKQISLLIDLVRQNVDICSLIIYGSGFKEIIGEKIDSNIIYDDSVFDCGVYKKYMTMCDYIVYFGFDEGAISILDAATLNIPVITTRQGYHMDISMPKGSLLFKSSNEIISCISNMIESIRGSNNIIEPIWLLNDTHSRAKKKYIIWMLRSILIPFKKNPYRAKDDFKVFIFVIFRYIMKSVLRIESTFNKSIL